MPSYSNGSASSVQERAPLWIPFSQTLYFASGALERAADCGFIKVTENFIKGSGFMSLRVLEFHLPFLNYGNFTIKYKLVTWFFHLKTVIKISSLENKLNQEMRLSYIDGHSPLFLQQ